jgi:Fur family peroxide stress response transcriptional regulator
MADLTSMRKLWSGPDPPSHSPFSPLQFRTILIKFLSMPSVEMMIARMRELGLKLTPQRRAILHELAGDETHPTAQELYGRLRQRASGSSSDAAKVSFATVYNVLASLSAVGLVAARQLGAGAARFDPNTTDHDHAVCDGCGVVIDVPRGPGAAAGLGDFHVRAVEKIYRGLCASCSSAA